MASNVTVGSPVRDVASRSALGEGKKNEEQAARVVCNRRGKMKDKSRKRNVDK